MEKIAYKLFSILGFLYFSILCYKGGELYGTEGVLRFVLAIWTVFGYCFAIYKLGRESK